MYIFFVYEASPIALGIKIVPCSRGLQGHNRLPCACRKYEGQIL